MRVSAASYSATPLGPEPMLTLGIETATATCAVALLDGSSCLTEAALHLPRSHGRRLAPLIQEALAHAGRSPEDIGLVAVSIGPGSYTGLRIGLGTAKGLALSTGADLVGVSTLDALAEAASAPDLPLVAVLPSRRGEVYAARSRAPGGPLGNPVALALSEADAWVPKGAVAVTGPGASRLVEAVPSRTWHRLGAGPNAVAVVRAGQRLVDARGPDDPASLEPAYLKPVATSQPRAIFGP